MGGKSLSMSTLTCNHAEHVDSVQAFDQWAHSHHIIKQFDLKFLKDCTIGIDAVYYLQNLPQEPLLSALGGAPLALESIVENAIAELQKYGIQLHFVFNGLDSGFGYDAAVSSARAAQTSHEAFDFYETKRPNEAQKTFRNTGMEDL